MPFRYCRLGVLAVILLLTGLIAGTGGVAGSVEADTEIHPQVTNSSDGSTNASNITHPHVNPDEVDESGDSQRVANYLTTRLGARLNASAIAVSNEAYEDGRIPLGEEYDVLLEQYAAVADDIDAERTVAQFNLTREQQRDLIESAQELNQTGAAYQRAVENGDDEQARQLAREILETTEELNTTSAELEEQYATLEADTGINLDAATSSLNESQQQIEQVAAAVAQREFTQAELSVETNRSTISTSTPVTVSGTLTTTDNESIENASVSVGIGNDTITTQTADDGSFNTTYRPLTAPVTASTLAVAYEPAPTTPYLPVTVTRNVSITEQTDVDLVIDNSSETAAFAETVRATGSIQLPIASHRNLDGIPLVLTVDGQRLETATTDANGTVSLAAALPAAIPSGETNLSIAFDRQNLAVAPSTTTTQLTVQPTATSLSVDAETNTTNTTNVTVTGQLSTANGDSLADRELHIAIDNTVLGTVETDQSGAYQATFTVPDTIGQTAELAVTFDGEQTSLAASTATQQLAVGAAGGNQIGILVAGGVLLASLSAVLFLRRSEWNWIQQLRMRITNEDRSPENTPADSTLATPFDVTDSLGEDSSASAQGVSIEQAQTALAAGYPNAAVQIAYGVVRQQLRSDSSPPGETHWEYYRRWQRVGRPNTDQLRRLTELYETAAFSQQDIPADTADEIVSTIQRTEWSQPQGATEGSE